MTKADLYCDTNSAPYVAHPTNIESVSQGCIFIGSYPVDTSNVAVPNHRGTAHYWAGVYLELAHHSPGSPPPLATNIGDYCSSGKEYNCNCIAGSPRPLI